MNTRSGVLLGLVVLGVLCAIGTAAADNTTGSQGMQPVDTIQPYNGPVGADSSLYGLKIAFENLDEAFTFNQSERLEKEIDHSDLRLAELESALAANRTAAADQALDQYWQKLNQTERTLGLFNGTGFMPVYNGTYNWTGPMSGFNGTGSMPMFNGTGPVDPSLMYAQERILSHQALLQNLTFSHPGIPGLARAYNDSRNLEQMFEQKTQIRFDRVVDTDNRIWLRPYLITAAQNRSMPVYTQEQPGPSVNRIIPVVRTQNQYQNQNPNQNQNQNQYQNQYQHQRQYQPTNQVTYSNGNGNSTRDTRTRF